MSNGKKTTFAPDELEEIATEAETPAHVTAGGEEPELPEGAEPEPLKQWIGHRTGKTPVLVRPDEFKLVPGFGIPDRTKQVKGKSKYRIDELKVGDAIVGTLAAVRGASVAARTYQDANPGFKCATFALTDGRTHWLGQPDGNG